jgi:DNA-binding NarL/FixJ family response regulator
MSTVVFEVGNCPTNPVWQEQFLAHILPVVENLARRRFRSLPKGEQEEATAEAVAGALISFVRLVRRGRDPREFASRLAQIALLRVLAGRLAGSPDRSQDVLSRLARQQRGFTVRSLEVGERLEGDSDQAPHDWRDLVLEDHRSTPAEIAITRLDFTAWLGRMNQRRRQIAERLAAGYRTEEVARQFRLSPGRISQLRREFEASWEEFQRDAPHAVQAPSHTA